MEGDEKMLNIKKPEDTRVKCQYCESVSLTIIFKEKKPTMVCDKCGLPQTETKPESSGEYNGIYGTGSVPIGWVTYTWTSNNTYETSEGSKR